MKVQPILNTKFFAPPLEPGHILRPRVTENFNRGLKSKLMLVSAAAGFGKSVLVHEWLESIDIPYGWLTLEKEENYFPRFTAYFITVLQKLKINFAPSILQSLMAPQPPSPESIFTILINDILKVKEDFILVCDDFHNIDSPEIEKAMSFLILNMPPSMHLVIISREDPQLPLGRLRAKGQLMEIRTHDLRFSLDEIKLFLSKVEEISLTEEEVSILYKKIEGWITGYRLAAASLKNHKEKSSIIHSFTGNHRFIYDYLLQEVLNNQSKEIQEFLIKVSIFDRVCGPLCDQLLESNTNLPHGEVLEKLHQMNLFIKPMDDIRLWYQFNNFFKDFLYQHLQSSRHDLYSLHQRAGKWFEENGLVTEAFQHYAAAQDNDAVAELIYQNFNLSHIPGFIQMSLNWMDALSKEELEKHPEVLILKAIYLIGTGQVAGVKDILHSAGTFYDSFHPDKVMRGIIAISNSALALSQYKFESVRTYATEALEILPEEVLPYRSNALWMLGMVSFFAKDLLKARELFSESYRMSILCDNHYISILTLISQGQIDEMENQLFRAEDHFLKVLDLAGQPALPIICEGHLGLAKIYYEHNKLEKSSGHALDALLLARQFDQNVDRFILCELFIVKMKRILGEFEQAQNMLQNLTREIHIRGYEGRLIDLAIEKTHLLIARQQFEEAETVAQQYSLSILKARILFSKDLPELALELLLKVLEQKEDLFTPRETLEIQKIRMLSYYKIGNKDEAFKILDNISIAVQKGGLTRFFLDEGLPMMFFLMETPQNHQLREYTQDLITQFSNEKKISPKSRCKSSRRREPQILEPLSPRELKVLNLIAEGNSNQEIGENLYISLDTVKGHNRRIFQKLNVENRIQAVNTARTLGIIE